MSRRHIAEVIKQQEADALAAVAGVFAGSCPPSPPVINAQSCFVVFALKFQFVFFSSF